MARDDRLHLGQMLDAARRVNRLAREWGRRDFDDEDVVQLASLQLIQRLGEAASRLTADFRAAHPELPWAQMIGMRNRIVHSYDDVDPEIIWQVASADVEPVIAALERVLEK
jgi:uncharacterized protein with HEPN domain